MFTKIEPIIRAAGQMILGAHHTNTHQKEGHFNFVTDTDMAVQSFLHRELENLFPGVSFFSEEQENSALTDAPTFVIDPIDGTINFMRSRCQSAISIAYLTEKQPMAALIYNPYNDELFTAEKGKGAFLNNRKIHVSQTPFERSLISFGTSPYDAELARQTLKCAADFLLSAGDLRRTGSACIDLCDIACGRTDVFFELRLRPWDVAAGALLIQEAGGFFHSIGHDAPYFEQACGVICSNLACKEEALSILRRNQAL